MMIPRVNTTTLAYRCALMACLGVTDWRRRFVRGELPSVRTGLMCQVPVVVEELARRRTVRWMRES